MLNAHRPFPINNYSLEQNDLLKEIDMFFYYIYGLILYSVLSIKKMSVSLCLSVGTYVRGECSESAETAGVVAP